MLRHEIPDAIPNAWGGCETAGLHLLAYHRLTEALGLPARPVRVDTFMFNAVPDADVLMKMNGDVLLVASPNMCARPLRSAEGWRRHELFGIDVEMTDDYDISREPDGRMFLIRNGRKGQCCPKGGYYFDDLPGGDLFADAEVPDPADYRPNHSIREEKLRALEEAARAAYGSTEFALCMGETLTDLQLTPGGMIGWYDVLLNEPDIAHEYLEKATDAAMDQLTELDQAVGKYCSMLSIAHDLGDRRGVTMGPRLFREIYKPHYKRYFDGWHERTKMKVNLHSCGAIADIIPDLIDCGVDVLNPVQISGDGMAPEKLRALAGDRLVLYGGAFDSVQTPPDMPADAVYEQVKQNIACLAAGGNYLFAGVHNTPADTPAEHIRAVLRAYNDTRDLYSR